MDVDIYNPRTGHLQNELIDWTNRIEGWDVAGTLTFQPYVHNLCKNHRYTEAIKGVHHYWNLVDRRVYGRAGLRKNIRVPRVGFFQHEDSNMHYHFIARSPFYDIQDHVSRFGKSVGFRRRLSYLWGYQDELGVRRAAIKVAGVHNRFKPIADANGWIEYISREVKWSGTDGLDVGGAYMPI